MTDQKITPESLRLLKGKKKIIMLTAYDFSLAHWLDQTGIEMILVGDSAANVMLGYENTLPISVEELLLLTRAVRRAVKNSLLVADLPAAAFRNTPEEAYRAARRFLDEAGADAIKIEGLEHLTLIERLIAEKAAVMGHLGFTPQLQPQARLWGKDQTERDVLLAAAQRLEKAGVFSVVLELVEENTARKITRQLKIPTIGIGSGADCDGQVRVTHDLLGLYARKSPKFVQPQAEMGKEIIAAVERFIQEVRTA